MRSVKKFLLTLLAMLPVASISTAAYCSLSDMAGQNQTDLLRYKVAKARRLLFPNGVMTTTYEAARERLAQETGITDEQMLEDEFNRQIKILMDNRLIETNEMAMSAGTPSAW